MSARWSQPAAPRAVPRTLPWPVVLSASARASPVRPPSRRPCLRVSPLPLRPVALACPAPALLAVLAWFRGPVGVGPRPARSLAVPSRRPRLRAPPCLLLPSPPAWNCRSRSSPSSVPLRRRGPPRGLPLVGSDVAFGSSAPSFCFSRFLALRHEPLAPRRVASSEELAVEFTPRIAPRHGRSGDRR